MDASCRWPTRTACSGSFDANAHEDSNVTAPARITQADIDRATKAAARLERARVVIDFDKRRIEIIIGEKAPPSDNGWSDDDV